MHGFISLVTEQVVPFFLDASQGLVNALLLGQSLGEFLVDEARVLKGFKLVEIGTTNRRGETKVEIDVSVFDPSNWIKVVIEV